MSLTKPAITLSLTALLSACGGNDIETVQQSSPYHWLNGETLFSVLNDRDDCKSTEWKISDDGFSKDVVEYRCERKGVEEAFKGAWEKYEKTLAASQDRKIESAKRHVSWQEKKLEEARAKLAKNEDNPQLKERVVQLERAVADAKHELNSERSGEKYEEWQEYVQKRKESVAFNRAEEVFFFEVERDEDDEVKVDAYSLNYVILHNKNGDIEKKTYKDYTENVLRTIAEGRPVDILAVKNRST